MVSSVTVPGVLAVLRTDYERDGPVSTTRSGDGTPGGRKARKASIHRLCVRICKAEPTSDHMLDNVEDR
jgi:hypothetical protein